MNSNDCLFFVQVDGEIWIPVELYEDPIDALEAMRDCEAAMGLPVLGVMNSYLVREPAGVGARVVGVGM